MLHGMWDLPGPGIELMSPALAGGFPTTVPPGKSEGQYFIVTMEENLYYMYSTKIKIIGKKFQVAVVAMQYLD